MVGLCVPGGARSQRDVLLPVHTPLNRLLLRLALTLPRDGQEVLPSLRRHDHSETNRVSLLRHQYNPRANRCVPFNDRHVLYLQWQLDRLQQR